MAGGWASSRRGPGRRHPGRWRTARPSGTGPEVRQDLVDHRALGDDRHDPHGALARRARERVHLEELPQECRPAAGGLGGCGPGWGDDRPRRVGPNGRESLVVDRLQATKMILHQPKQRRGSRAPWLVDAEDRGRRRLVSHARPRTVERRAYGRPARGPAPWYCAAGHSDATSACGPNSACCRRADHISPTGKAPLPSARGRSCR